jgi:hypothetical protein
VEEERLMNSHAAPDCAQDEILILHATAKLLRHTPSLAIWCRARSWERADLADWLGVTVDQLAAMALVPTCQAHLAERYGADPTRLVEVLG